MKKKNKVRIIQIAGLRGILSACFIGVCLAAGFVGFPALMLTKIWNHFAQTCAALPYINIFQGIILWAILAVSYVILNREYHFLVAFEPQTTTKDIKKILSEIKAQRNNMAVSETTEPIETQEINAQHTTNDTENTEEKSKEVV